MSDNSSYGRFISYNFWENGTLISNRIDADYVEKAVSAEASVREESDTELHDDIVKKVSTVIFTKEDDNSLVYHLTVDDTDYTINIPEDQFLKSVNYDSDNKQLIFVFHTTDGDKTVNVSMNDLVDTYTAGDGLSLASREFSARLNPDTQPYIVITSDGISIIGINEALESIKEEVMSYADEKIGELQSVIDEINSKIDDLVVRIDNISTGEEIEENTRGNYGAMCLYDKTNDKLIIVEKEGWSVEKYPSDSYTAVGVVAVPASHDVYGTGECGVISLASMDYNSPETGSDEEVRMYWGGCCYGGDLDYLYDYTTAPYTGTAKDVKDGITVLGTTSGGNLPSDSLSGVQCPTDEEAFYYYESSNTSKITPSPYLIDGSRNPAYYSTEEPSSADNILSDFEGKTNTKILTDVATELQGDGWLTNTTVTNNSSIGYYPAACCCWRYHTKGTEQGDWYLPAGGEMGYVCVRLNAINDSISKLIEAYDDAVGVEMTSTYRYLTSTENGEKTANSLLFTKGDLHSVDKNVISNARAFLRIKP